MNDRKFRERIAELLAKRRGVKREDSKKEPPESQKFKLKVRRSKGGIVTRSMICPLGGAGSAPNPIALSSSAIRGAGRWAEQAMFPITPYFVRESSGSMESTSQQQRLLVHMDCRSGQLLKVHQHRE